MVYPDRVRILSKRRTVDIPFDQIKEVRTIPYQHTHMFGPVTMWEKISLNCDPRYTGFGLGQSGILHGVRHVIRIESPRWVEMRLHPEHGKSGSIYGDLESRTRTSSRIPPCAALIATMGKESVWPNRSAGPAREGRVNTPFSSAAGRGSVKRRKRQCLCGSA